MPKLFEALVVSRMKQNINGSMTKFQIGGTAGHRPQEHIFTIKSFISLSNLLNIDILVTLFDIRKFFDRENLRDCMDALYRAGVEDKMYRLWFLLNQKTSIRVATPVGLTKYEEKTERIGEESLGGALISACNLDSDVDDYFRTSDDVCYGKVRLQPLL